MTSQNTESLASTDEFMGHPKGLAFIVFTEAWERFSFYGMQALMVLYMSSYLFLPDNIGKIYGFSVVEAALSFVFGQLSNQALIAQLFGLYIGFVYLAPVLGGFLGDRFLGRRHAVLWGAASMAIGHFLMAFESYFLFAMLALIIGSGLLKGNLAAQVGELYSKSDSRRDSAYSYYSISINIGAFIAPLICGTLGELYGWHYGFLAAGVGMLLGIAIYLKGMKYLHQSDAKKISRQPLSVFEKRKVWLLMVIMLSSSLYWIGQTQVWNSYPLWVKARVDRDLFSFTVPITWFQSIDTLAVLLFAPLVLLLWSWQRKRKSEPEDIFKLAIGCACFATGAGLLSIAEIATGPQQTIAIIWPLLFHGICAFAYLYSAPIALSLASRLAPESVNSMMVGGFYLAIFIGSVVSGKLGSLFNVVDHSTFWLIHGAIAALGSVIFVLLAPRTKAIFSDDG